ncbi:MAG: glycosyltransferase, partial [Acidimicrobiales bacterium]
DKDLSWRTQLAGFELWFAPEAVVHRRQRSTMRAAFSQHVRYGQSSARLYVRFRPYGMSRPTTARRLKEWARLLAQMPWLLARDRRVRFAEVAGLRLGRCVLFDRSARAGWQVRPEQLGKVPATDCTATRRFGAGPEVPHSPSAQ